MTLCKPSLVYLAFSLLSTIMAILHKSKIVLIAVKLFWIAVWTWFLNFVCVKGHTNVAWGLVVAPYIIIFIALITGVVKMSDLQEAVAKEEKKESLVVL